MAAHLVRSLAKYAAGSGISEIKCILAGFVMKGFLGFATFFIKSITLVSVLCAIPTAVVYSTGPATGHFIRAVSRKGRSLRPHGLLCRIFGCGPFYTVLSKSRYVTSKSMQHGVFIGTGKMREIITAASAAGVAVAFGSPIGGVLFSIEVRENIDHFPRLSSI